MRKKRSYNKGRDEEICRQWVVCLTIDPEKGDKVLVKRDESEKKGDTP